MRLDWTTIVGSIIATWPPIIAGFIINWNKTRNHVDASVLEQNKAIAQITNAQTQQIAAMSDRQTETLLADGQPPQ